ncbi:hypothetical protein H6784_03375 [Candidatus Nomurabacteria bacterium]|nr:hypothetical protein [Candidatus Kaiserbacteria bacterium]MCB9811132.1 hypothetical protein [Candidatus Nomurabacteria bacterium]MCB9814432.1 hypothetical protein [Candidatus Nomurabacteria bacterium]
MEFSIESFYQSIETFNFLIASGVFIAYLIVDAMYAHYTLAVTELNAL